jgi:hypothetical protein
MDITLLDMKRALTPTELALVDSEMARCRKSLGIAYLLLFLLGYVGGHQYYLGKPRAAFLRWLPWFVVGFAVLAMILNGDAEYRITIGLASLWAVAMHLYDLCTLPRQTQEVNAQIEKELILAVHP